MVALAASPFPRPGNQNQKPRQGFYYRKHLIEVLLLGANELSSGAKAIVIARGCQSAARP
jgi:hypothetical protein